MLQFLITTREGVAATFVALSLLCFTAGVVVGFYSFGMAVMEKVGSEQTDRWSIIACSFMTVSFALSAVGCAIWNKPGSQSAALFLGAIAGIFLALTWYVSKVPSTDD